MGLTGLMNSLPVPVSSYSGMVITHVSGKAVRQSVVVASLLRKPWALATVYS